MYSIILLSIILFPFMIPFELHSTIYSHFIILILFVSVFLYDRNKKTQIIKEHKTLNDASFLGKLILSFVVYFFAVYIVGFTLSTHQTEIIVGGRDIVFKLQYWIFLSSLFNLFGIYSLGQIVQFDTDLYCSLEFAAILGICVNMIGVVERPSNIQPSLEYLVESFGFFLILLVFCLSEIFRSKNEMKFISKAAIVWMLCVGLLVIFTNMKPNTHIGYLYIICGIMLWFFIPIMIIILRKILTWLEIWTLQFILIVVLFCVSSIVNFRLVIYSIWM